MHYPVFVQRTFALFRFFGKNVTLKRFLVCDLSCACYFEPFLGTGISLNFWHGQLQFNFYTLLAFRTGGHLWSLVGNPPFLQRLRGNGRKSTQKI
jgi:hypothetical protein